MARADRNEVQSLLLGFIPLVRHGSDHGERARDAGVPDHRLRLCRR